MEERQTDELQMDLRELKKFLENNKDYILKVSVSRDENERSQNKTGIKQSGD